MNETTHILVVDDDPMFCQLLGLMLRGRGFTGTFQHAAAAIEPELRKGTYAAVLLDWSLGDTDGLDALQSIRARHPSVPVILATATCSTDLAVSAIRLGAFDFLTKPLDEARLIATITRAAEQHRLLNRISASGTADPGECEFEGLLGVSPLMRTVFRAIQNIAPADVSVMITGETGTGKELVARALHRRSGRASKPFVPLNMAALPKELVEATLFGHEKGAFTGADRRRAGAVEEAMGGTLFLDEIGEMPLDLQSKLLRFIQERVFRRVGGSEDIKADIRIVSATNRDPLEEVRAGRLRADLYYRLNVVPIELPPLRDRFGDVALIAQHCLSEFARTYRKEFRTFDPDVLALLADHTWPGNVRQLRHLIERIVITNSGTHVSQSMLPGEILGSRLGGSDDETATPAPGRSPAQRDSIIPMSELERRAIQHALIACKGSAPEAASKLGMSPATIYRKIKEYGLSTTKGGG